jgi:hypothetical protein
VGLDEAQPLGVAAGAAREGEGVDLGLENAALLDAAAGRVVDGAALCARVRLDIVAGRVLRIDPARGRVGAGSAVASRAPIRLAALDDDLHVRLLDEVLAQRLVELRREVGRDEAVDDPAPAAAAAG